MAERASGRFAQGARGVWRILSVRMLGGPNGVSVSSLLRVQRSYPNSDDVRVFGQLLPDLSAIFCPAPSAYERQNT